MRLIESIRFIGFLELETEEHEAKGSLTAASSCCAGQLTLRVYELTSAPKALECDRKLAFSKFRSPAYCLSLRSQRLEGGQPGTTGREKRL